MLTREEGIATYHVDTLPLWLLQDKVQPFARLDVNRVTQNYTQWRNLGGFFRDVSTVCSDPIQLLRPQGQIL